MRTSVLGVAKSVIRSDMLRLPLEGVRACLYDPGQAGRDAYRDPARNTNYKECLYDTVTYPA